jgi:hypothetical protein
VFNVSARAKAIPYAAGSRIYCRSAFQALPKLSEFDNSNYQCRLTLLFKVDTEIPGFYSASISTQQLYLAAYRGQAHSHETANCGL